MSDPIMKLPVTTREKLFSFFLGGTLRNCRLVNKEWNNFVMDHMWGTNKGRRQLQANLEGNWRRANPNDYNVIETYEEINIRGVVEAMSSNFVAIRTHSSVILERARIQIYDVTEKTFWEIPNVFENLYFKAKYNYFDVVISDKLVAVKTKVKSVFPVSNLQVWSIQSREKLIDEDIDNLHHVEASRTFSDDNILVIFGDSVEVWDFEDHPNTRRVLAWADNSAFSSGHFFKMFITQNLYFTQSQLHQIYVWKYEREQAIVRQHVFVMDFKEFTVLRTGVKVSYKVHEIVYIGNCFLVSCRVPFPGEPFQDRSLSVRVLGDNGLLLREVFMPQFDCDAIVGFFIRENRMLFAVEDHMIICQQTTDEVGDPEFPKALSFKRINHLPGTIDVMLRNTEASSVRTVGFFGGMQMLRITTLNFWRTV